MERVMVRCNKLSVLLLKKLNKLNELPGYDMYVGPTDEASIETPCPYNCWVNIKDDEDGIEQLVLEGSATTDGLGYCNVTIPLKKANMYEISITGDEELPEWVRKI